MTRRAGAVRSPEVAGLFYPGAAEDLGLAVDALLEQAQPALVPRPVALLAPHAGYIYSGSVAADAYAALRPHRASYRHVLVAGPAHRMAMDRMALVGAQTMMTPLGSVTVDADLTGSVAGLDGVMVAPHAYDQEHCIEVQLPFLQRVLPGVPVLPLLVGHAPVSQVAAVMAAAAALPDTLLVVSSDLSHYLPYGDAQSLDAFTIEQVMGLTYAGDTDQACGGIALAALVHLARGNHWTPTLLQMCNSGDTAGAKDRVVGYASVTFHPQQEDNVGRHGHH